MLKILLTVVLSGLTIPLIFVLIHVPLLLTHMVIMILVYVFRLALLELLLMVCQEYVLLVAHRLMEFTILLVIMTP